VVTVEGIVANTQVAYNFMSNKIFLKKVQIFSGLSGSDLDKIVEIVSERNYRKDEVIFHADDPGSVLFILKTGAVKVSIRDKNGREDILKLLYPLDFFGEMSILDGQHRSATVTAIEKSTALIIQRDHFVRSITKCTQMALNMLVLLSRRIRKTDEKIASLRFDDAYGKVARILLDLSETQGTRGEEGIVLALKLTRQEMADFVGLSRETLTKTLAEFQRSGCIKIEDKSILILDERMLRRELC
jgi:CRP-like cAMP-binding protein